MKPSVECPVCGYLTADFPCEVCGGTISRQSRIPRFLSRSANLGYLKSNLGGIFTVSAVLFLLLLAHFACDQTPAFPMDVVIDTIAKEASGESLEAQAYVAATIRQRAKERKLTFEQVCLQPYQFSCWDKGTKQKPRTAKEYETAQKAWDLSEAITDRPTHYYDVSIKPPYWTKKMQFVKAIGRLRFYREGA